jgi:hypothetical protein
MHTIAFLFLLRTFERKLRIKPIFSLNFMQYGICNLAVIPLKADASDVSEQTSQLLYGETFEILDWQDRWVKVRTTFDQYEGWISRLQFCMIGHMAYHTLMQDPAPLTYRPVTQAWKIPDNSVLYLPICSSLVFLTGTTSHICNEQFQIIGEIGEVENIVNTAKSFLNTPYLWGGRTHYGIDCSGFTQTVFKLQGIKLNRDASLQATQGTLVEALKDIKTGDLAFFENQDGKITHVGLLLGNDEIIHASGKVKIDQIDSRGIYSSELKRYTHKLSVIRRYF